MDRIDGGLRPRKAGRRKRSQPPLPLRQEKMPVGGTTGALDLEIEELPDPAQKLVGPRLGLERTGGRAPGPFGLQLELALA